MDICTGYPRLNPPARRSCRIPCASLAILILGALTGTLQGQETLSQGPAPRTGFQISSVSGYAVYYSTGLPEGSFQAATTPLPSDLGLGGSVQLDWSHLGEKSRVMFTYTPSYTGRLRFAAWNALNHAGSFNATRQYGRWKFAFAAAADLSNLSEMLFSPTVFARVAAVPVSFNDLAAAVVTGAFTNAQLASLLTGAPLVESPGRNLFFGERMFTASVQASAAYAPTPRLSLKFGASASRNQHVSDTLAGATQNAYLIPRTSLAGANLNVSYAWSSRTQLGVSASSQRVVSRLEDVYFTTETASFGKTMGRRWFLQLSGGLAIINPVRSTFTLTTAPQPVVNGSLGFHTLTHTFLGSYSRTGGDSYGLGATTTSSIGGNWRWTRPGRSWWTESSVSWQQLGGGAFANSSGLQAEGGFGRNLGNHLALLTQCVYLHYSQQLSTVPPLSQTAVRVSLVWRPAVHAFQ